MTSATSAPFNPDRIDSRCSGIRTSQHFLRGELDTFAGHAWWHDKTRLPEFEQGYRATLVLQPDSQSHGLYLNTADPLRWPHVRLGIQHALNSTLLYLRGLPTPRGYGSGQGVHQHAQGPPVLTSWRASAAKAGFTKPGPDGALQNDKGQPALSIFTTAGTPSASPCCAKRPRRRAQPRAQPDGCLGRLQVDAGEETPERLDGLEHQPLSPTGNISQGQRQQAADQQHHEHKWRRHHSPGGAVRQSSTSPKALSRQISSDSMNWLRARLSVPYAGGPGAG